MSADAPEPIQRLFVLELWDRTRPLLLNLAVDFVAGSAVLIWLWGLGQIKHWFPAHGIAAPLLPFMHEVAAVAIVSICTGFMLHDVYRFHMERKE